MPAHLCIHLAVQSLSPKQSDTQTSRRTELPLRAVGKMTTEREWPVVPALHQTLEQ